MQPKRARPGVPPEELSGAVTLIGSCRFPLVADGKPPLLGWIYVHDKCPKNMSIQDFSWLSTDRTVAVDHRLLHGSEDKAMAILAATSTVSIKGMIWVSVMTPGNVPFMGCSCGLACLIALTCGVTSWIATGSLFQPTASRLSLLPLEVNDIDHLNDKVKLHLPVIAPWENVVECISSRNVTLEQVYCVANLVADPGFVSVPRAPLTIVPRDIRLIAVTTFGDVLALRAAGVLDRLFESTAMDSESVIAER